MRTICPIIAAFAASLAAFAGGQTDVSYTEAWNEGVEYYRAGDVTNALRVLRPLMLTRRYAARSAEVVAKLEFERGNLEEAASAAQIALRANPSDAKASRNGKPHAVIAHTIKGKGVSYMENQASWHGKAPNADELAQALEELA